MNKVDSGVVSVQGVEDRGIEDEYNGDSVGSLGSLMKGAVVGKAQVASDPANCAFH